MIAGPDTRIFGRLLQVLFWSVISAAFIGPGTVTTAAAAGAGYGYALLWALVFSTFATIVLQEASARVTIVTGRSLAAAIRQKYHGRPAGVLFLLVIIGAILLGCAAYQAGNVLGSAAGATLRLEVSPRWVTLTVSVAAGALLWFGSTRFIARLLGIIVAVMGFSFLVTAALSAPSPGAVLRGVWLPRIPAGAGLLAIGLIGTTVVPYNLFLGSGIAHGQRLGDARFGIATAVAIGGLISMAILVTAVGMQGEFGFAALADVLAERLGKWAPWLLAVGLFTAGLSSAITAPLAAAVTARGLFATGSGTRWGERAWRYRGVWLAVVACGLVFGLAGVRPVPAIVLAQAFNGLLLPLVAAFLFVIVNDRTLLGAEHVSTRLGNGLMLLVFAVTVLLGATSLLQAAARLPGIDAVSPQAGLVVSTLLAVVCSAALWRRSITRPRHGEP